MVIGIWCLMWWDQGAEPLTREITIWDIEHHEVSEMLRMLADRGLVANRDFEFGYHPAFVNLERGGPNRRSVVFRFPDSATATWFCLKYSL
jgi:hypothetical protein